METFTAGGWGYSDIFGVFRKIDILRGGMKIFCGYFFGVITKLDYISGTFLCILGSFLKVKVQNGESSKDQFRCP